jgi:hypothetical protein
LTIQSAVASDTQSGATGPAPKIGSASFAQDTSFEGSNHVKAPENAMEKNSAVSTDAPTSVDTSGAFHHVPPRKAENTPTSKSCAVKNASPDPTAMRKVTKGPNSPMICVPTSEQKIPTMNPENDVPRRASPVDAVHDVRDQKGDRVGECPPGQPVSKQVLYEDVRRDHRGRHCQYARQVISIHFISVFYKVAET